MNNICIFTNTLRSGGAEKQAVLLAKALNKKNNVWLVVYYGNQVEEKFLKIIEGNDIQTLLLQGSHFSKIISLLSFLKNERIDIIFSYLLTTNLIGGLIGKMAGVNYFYPGIRNAVLKAKKEKFQRFIQNKLSTKTIYNNYKGLEYLSKRGFDKDKSIVLPNCFDLNYERKIRSKNDKIVILSLGRFVQQKDWFTALKAIKLLHEKCQNFIYYVVGYGVLEKEIRNWVDANDASGYIDVVIAPKDVNEYYTLVDIYLQTSLFEGLSNTVLEAMSFTLPLVVTDAGDNDKLAIDGENGYLCDVGDIKAIAKKLEILVNDYEKRIEFGVNSYNKLKENYSFERFQKNYLELIENLETK